MTIRREFLRAWSGPGLVLLVVLTFATIIAFQNPGDYTSDQLNHGTVVIQRLKPENYARDYAFSDPDIFGYYTPTFVGIITDLTRLSGSFREALAWLILPVAGVYLISMTWLLYRITRHRWLSVGVTLVSTYGSPALPLADYWVAILQRNRLTPRSLYQAVIPILLGCLLILLDERKGRHPAWAWGLYGLGLGMAANLHPVSAEATGIVFGGLVTLALLRSKVRLSDAWAAVPGVFLGAAPMLAAFFSGTEQVPVESYGFTFDTFYEIGDWRIETVWPWTWHNYRGIGQMLGIDSLLTPGLQTVVVVGHAVLSGAIAYGLWLTQRRDEAGRIRWVLWVALATVQVAMLVFLILGLWWLSIFVVIYLAYRLLHDGGLDWLDRRLLESVALIISLVLVTLVLQWLWRRYEVWELTLWGTQLPRGLRFVYLPAFIMLARLVALLYERRDWPVLVGVVALLALWSILRLTPPNGEVAEIGITFALGLMWLGWPHPDDRPIVARAAIVGLAGALVTEIFVGRLLQDQSHWPALVMGLGLAMLMWARDRWRSLRRPTLVALSLAAIATLALLTPVSYGEDAPPPSRLAALPPAIGGYASELWGSAFPLNRIPIMDRNERSTQALYEWGRTLTPTDALFFTSSNEFRLEAQRSITHAKKDLGTAFFLRYPLVTFYNRFQQFEDAYDDPASLREAARSVEADFVIVERKDELDLGWPVAYENEHYQVYFVIY